MFDGLKIRNKLVLLVAGPMIIIVLLAALGASSRQDAADRSADVATLVSSAERNATLVDALQTEAIYSAGYVASGRQQWKDELTEARKRTDAAGEAAVGPLTGAVPAMSSNLRATSTLAVNGYERLPHIRATVDDGYVWTQVVDTFQETETAFLIVNDAIAATVSDPTVGAKLRTSAAVAAYKATLARQGALLLGARNAGSFGENGLALYQDAKAEEQSKLAILNSLADNTDKGAIRDALTNDGRLSLDAIHASASAATATSAFTAHEPAEIATAVGEVLSSLHDVEVNLDRQLVQTAEQAKSDAEQSAKLFIAGAVLAVALVAGAAILLGRRITRPLRTLTEAADRLSNEQMPKLVESLRNPAEDELSYQLSGLKAIEVTSNDEIGQLASAFNNVQKVAGEVAAEQAALLRKGIGEMFVNLARRNQALLDRQIDFIDELERAEEDPDQLENLYRLDHLATRMRRNAESLLVLAGAEPPRRRGRPAPLANVVRAALAEVEDFARIELLSLDEVLVASNAAADIAHLLSELMENATNFSPPETKVEVVGHRTKADGYIVSVSDHGIGMSAEQMAEANELLAKPPVVGLALSRSLGFIVVGRLARRHGITVKTMASASGGVTALVTLPPSLVTDGLTPAGGGGPIPSRPVAVADPVPESTEPSDGLPPLTFPAPTERPGADAPTRTDTPAAPAALASAPTAEGAEPGVAAAPLSFSPTGPTRRPAVVPTPNGNGSSNGALPTRRLTASPAPGRTNGSAPAAEVPEGEVPAGSEVEAPEAKKLLPPPAVFDSPPPAEPPAAAPAEPEADDEPTVHSDGPPPAAPLPTRGPRSARPEAPAAPAATSTGGFLVESEPPRLFGRGAEPSGPPTGPSATPPLAPASSSPDDGGTRLFGSTPPAGGGVPPLASRSPRGGANGHEVNGNGANGHGANGNGSSNGNGAVAVTASGLAKRTPRSAGGARAIPGADVERGVGATRRSPDEVRNLLSRYRDGQQRGRSDPANPAVEEIEQ